MSPAVASFLSFEGGWIDGVAAEMRLRCDIFKRSMSRRYSSDQRILLSATRVHISSDHALTSCHS